MNIDAPNAALYPQLRSLWQEAFGDEDAFLDSFFATGFSPDRCRCITWNDRCVAALYWFDCLWEGKKVAYLYAVATDKVFQGKGFCRSLMENTHGHLKSLGYHGAVLVPAEEALFRMYEKMGYVTFGGMDPWELAADQAGVALEEIDPEAYRKCREDFLPRGSIRHTAAALNFAGTYGKFYRGEDFLLWASVQEETAYFQEYLGDRNRLTGILAALGAQKGKGVLPGQAPYAMYHTLTEDQSLPTYFAIPLN